MDTSRIIRGVVSNGRYTVTAPIVKEDYGLYLKIEGVELPSAYEVDFSNSENNGTSVTMIGNADGVLIPRQFIDSGKDVFAFLYHVGEDFGRTVYKFRIPNKVRPDRTNETPTPEQESLIDQTISALNDAVETAQENADKAEAAVEHYPQIVDGTWRVWDVENGQWLDTGIDAEAVDGVSPKVSISNANGIHTVIITDADGVKTATIYDGLSIIMLTSSFVIPTDENGVLTQDVRLVAKFRIMRGNTIIDGRVMPNSRITLVNPNAQEVRAVHWRDGVSVTDPQTDVTLPSGYKLLGNDSGAFDIKLRVGNTDYVVNPTWALAKRGEKGAKGDSPTITASKTGKTTSIYVDGSEVAQIEDGTDGTDGDDGYSPTASVAKSGKTTTITITDKTGTTSAQVEDGDDYILTEEDKEEIADMVEIPSDWLKAFPTDTASGAVASFPDGADDLPLKSLVVDIDPVQDLSQGDPSPENICPISGWTGVKVARTGKNILGGLELYNAMKATFTNSTFNDANHTVTSTPSQASGKKIIDIRFKENTAYTIIVQFSNNAVTSAGNGCPNIAFRYTDGSNTSLSVPSYTVNQVIVAAFASNPAKTLDRITGSWNTGAATIYCDNTGIFEGDMAVGDYTAYNGTTIPISWQTEAGTVYGGKLDVLSGKLTVYPEYDSYNGETLTGRWISDRDVYAVGTTPTIGAQVVNIGAEGTEYQLEPHEVKSLLGANNIFADTGDTACEYRADTKLYIERLTAPDSADMVSDANIVSGQYFMVGNTLYKATANIANGGQITVGTNCTRVSLAQALNEINA